MGSRYFAMHPNDTRRCCAHREEIMNRLVRGIFLPIIISLLITQGAWAKVYRHEPTGIVFPDRVALFEKWADVTDYETENPGLGISVAYNSPGITVTVYLYTMGMDAIPDNLQSPILQDHFKQAATDIERAGEQGYYFSVTKLSEGEVTWDVARTATTSLHSSYSYTQREQDRLSHLYLMGFRNHFLKIRFTYDKEIQQAAEKAQTEFLAAFSQILSDSRK